MGLNIVFLIVVGFILLFFFLFFERGRFGNGTGLFMLVFVSVDIELFLECELYICCIFSWELWFWRTTGEAFWDGFFREFDDVIFDSLAVILFFFFSLVGCCVLVNVVELFFFDVDGFVGGILLWVFEFEGDIFSGVLLLGGDNRGVFFFI